MDFCKLLPNELQHIIISYSRRKMCSKMMNDIIQYKMNRFLEKMMSSYSSINDGYVSDETYLRMRILGVMSYENIYATRLA